MTAMRIPAATRAALAAERRAAPFAVWLTQSPIEALDAGMECVHGRLAGDPPPPCACWAGEPA